MDICISEKKLEDFIFNHLNGTKIIDAIEPEIPSILQGCVHRQFSIGEYGVADIVSIDLEVGGAYPSVTVYELKQGKIDSSALIQALRYKKGLSHFLESQGYRYPGDSIICYLIGSDICHKDDFDISVSSLSDIYVYSYDLCPNTGLTLSREVWEKDVRFPQSLYRAFLETEYATCDNEAMFYKKHGELPF